MNTIKNVEGGARPGVGFVGVGAMGGPMARNLLAAGYSVTVRDLVAERVAACVAAGATAADSAADVARGADVVMVSVVSSPTLVDLAEEDLLPNARTGQVFVDLGTTEPCDTRRLAAAFAEKGATLIDAPVSGGPGGSEAGRLHIFLGGDEAAVERLRPVFEVLGDPQRVVYCGPSGSGQVVKGVNQLAMGLVAAAYMEAISYGVRGGVEPEAVARAVGGNEGWRARVAEIAGRAADGTVEHTYIKFPELPCFLAEAREQGFAMPMTDALFTFCDAGPRNWTDNVGRECVSFWQQLMNARTTGKRGSG